MNAKLLLKICPMALALGLAAVPGWAQTQVIVGGGDAASDLINGVALDALAFDTSVVIPDTGSPWHCVATCTAEIGGPGGGFLDDDGLLTITFDGVQMSGALRHFEQNDNAGVNDSAPIVVATTGRKLSIAAGTHTMICAAAKVAVGDANFTVNNSSLTYVCADNAS